MSIVQLSFDSPLFELSAIIYYYIAIISVSCSILDICSVSRFDWYRPIFRVKRDSLMNDSIAFVLDVSSITLGFFDIIKIIQRLSLYLVATSRIDDDKWNKFRAFSWIVYEKKGTKLHEKRAKRKYTVDDIYIYSSRPDFRVIALFHRQFSWQAGKNCGITEKR